MCVCVWAPRKIKENGEVGITVRTVYHRNRTRYIRRRITLSTHLHQGDEDDEERRRAARVVIGVVFSVPFFREEFIADHADHPESTNASRDDHTAHNRNTYRSANRTYIARLFDKGGEQKSRSLKFSEGNSTHER